LLALVLALAAVAGVGRTAWRATAPLFFLPPPQVITTETASDPVPLATRVQRVASGLVDIDTRLGYQGVAGAGTGIVLSPSGDVLTNNHVISGATSIRVTAIGTGRSYPATVLGYDRTRDVAVLHLQGALGLPTAPLGDSDRVAVGDEVAAIGNAGGVGGPPTVTTGRVTALDETITVSDDVTGAAQQLSGLIQVSAPMRPGDSGGALVNTAGQVIGVNTAASTGFQVHSSGAEGFAIPINQALAIARQIEAGSASDTVHIGPTGILGIQVQELSVVPGLGGGWWSGSGALVAGIMPGSPAERAGLVPGDVIVALDGTMVDSPATLTALLTRHHPGDVVRLTWVDPLGQRQSAPVQLASGPPN
jgi:S1-C subfamily serine protease